MMTNTQVMLLNYMREEPYIAADFLDCDNGSDYYEKWKELMNRGHSEEENIGKYYGNATYYDLELVRNIWLDEHMEAPHTNSTFSLKEIGVILDIELVRSWYEDLRDEFKIPIVYEETGECCCGCDFDIDEPEEDPDPRFARWDREYGFSRS